MNYYSILVYSICPISCKIAVLSLLTSLTNFPLAYFFLVYSTSSIFDIPLVVLIRTEIRSTYKDKCWIVRPTIRHYLYDLHFTCMLL